MSTYRKDKNFVIISLDGCRGDYRLDINTGIFYGIKGQPVKSCPKASEIRSMLPYYRSDEGNNLAQVLRSVFENTATSHYTDFVEAMQSADKVDALGFSRLTRVRIDQWEYLGENIKLLNEYAKEHGKDNLDFSDFKLWCEYEKIRSTLGTVAEQLTAEMYYAVHGAKPDITLDELSVCAYYLTRGKYWEYHQGDIRHLVHYLEWCRVMDKKPEKVNNFMREYCETKSVYKLRKTEFDNKKMALNFAKHSKAWEFEHGDFTIVIPVCGQDIVTEGDRMHHCVGSYVNRVVDGDCYICFIRRKSDPTTPYITCQVYIDGTIGQYFLAYDQYITSDADKEFYKAFEEHLKSVWNNE